MDFESIRVTLLNMGNAMIGVYEELQKQTKLLEEIRDSKKEQKS